MNKQAYDILVKDGNGRNPHEVSAAEYIEAGTNLALTAMQAIRQKCLDCTNDQYAEIQHCPCADCPLWPLRMNAYPKARAAFMKGT